MPRLRTWILIGLGGFAVAGSIGWAGFHNARPVPEFTVDVVRRQALKDSVAANGEIQPKTRVNVGVQVTAAIKEIHVQDGRWVKAGDTSSLRADLAPAADGWSSEPTESRFPAVTASRMRFVIDTNCDIEHGLIYSLQVFLACP